MVALSPLHQSHFFTKGVGAQDSWALKAHCSQNRKFSPYPFLLPPVYQPCARSFASLSHLIWRKTMYFPQSANLIGLVKNLTSAEVKQELKLRVNMQMWENGKEIRNRSQTFPFQCWWAMSLAYTTFYNAACIQAFFNIWAWKGRAEIFKGIVYA